MRRLLNTLYVMRPEIYLNLDGENIVASVEGKTVQRLPFDNVENIVCFSYLGCSPALMGKCVDKNIPINFISANGRYLAHVGAMTRGNVFLRIAQIDKFREMGLKLAKNTIAAKIYNCRRLIRRTLHDVAQLRTDDEINRVLEYLQTSITNVYNAGDMDTLRGMEGSAASSYFSIFNKLFKQNGEFPCFNGRTKHPPLDEVNATLSFFYTLATRDYASALETVGLDSYIGFFHSLRSGRPSLACDMVEEARTIVERFVLTLFNLQMLGVKDFEKQISGAVYLNDDGRKKAITAWQEKKRTDLEHPYLKQKISLGLLPYVQANLLAKFLRGEIEEYPNFVVR